MKKFVEVKEYPHKGMKNVTVDHAYAWWNSLRGKTNIDRKTGLVYFMVWVPDSHWDDECCVDVSVDGAKLMGLRDDEYDPHLYRVSGVYKYCTHENPVFYGAMCQLAKRLAEHLRSL